jgi:8-oxo-dGTP pyrophosphatase MutT (NUDIX family)
MVNVAAMFDALIQELKTVMAQPLPGLDVQMQMAPPQRGRPDMNWVMAQQPRRAGVLALLYPINDQPHIVLTLRHSYQGVHSDQISFPGGQVEQADPDLSYTALRETEEEIGIGSHHIKLLGPLSELYIPPSNFLVQPFLGYCAVHPPFIAQEHEVREILEVPLSFFVNPTSKETRTLQVRDMSITTPCYILRDKIIWGATAMMLRELETLVSPYFSSLEL